MKLTKHRSQLSRQKSPATPFQLHGKQKPFCLACLRRRTSCHFCLPSTLTDKLLPLLTFAWHPQSSVGVFCRKRNVGNFCHQHYNYEASNKAAQSAFFEDMSDLFQSAKDGWGQDQLHMARHSSLEENAAEKAQRLKSQQIVERRLEGDCLFVAVLWAGNLALDPYNFRQQVVQHLSMFPSLFRPWFDQKWSSFERYLAAMGRSGTWGDDICVIAMSHLLWRPICIVTDRENDDEALMMFEPPTMISQETCGEPIYISYLSSTTKRVCPLSSS